MAKGKATTTGKSSALATAVRTIAPVLPLAASMVSMVVPAHRGLHPMAAPVVTQGSQGAAGGTSGAASDSGVPMPLISKGHPVEWWFVFKLNAAAFPLCGSSMAADGGVDARACPFGAPPAGAPPVATTENGKQVKYVFGQRYVLATSEAPGLAPGGSDCLGDTTGDPVGATFDEVYNGSFHYVVWNDQFYGDPKDASCGGDGCDAPSGHSKGMLAWNDAGEGLVMQVSTPSWPAAGSARSPRRTDGNTLGCATDNDVKVSQHFFALHLTEPDVVAVLKGLNNASVVTKSDDGQIVNNGGPQEVQDLVSTLGPKSKNDTVFTQTLSSGVRLISKPSALHVPPWQMVSSVLGGVPLRAATWWADPQIYSTTAATTIACWDQDKPDPALKAAPGAVEIATEGTWNGKTFNLEGGPDANNNHAKIGVSTTATDHLAIFGDENQQGTIAPMAAAPGKKNGQGCDSSQNGRGGTFYVMQNEALSNSIAALIAGATAPTAAPAK